MNKMTVSAVEGLIFSVINDRLIPRLEKEVLTETEPWILQQYYYFHDYLKKFTQKEANFLAQKSLGVISKAFSGVEQEDLEDLISVVIASTLQGETNEFSKVKKSTFGFWEDSYDLKQSKNNFPKTFCHVFYKAVQSQNRNLETRKKHIVTCSSFATDNLDFDFMDTIADKNNEAEISENLEKFEIAVNNMKAKVLADEKLDDIDRKIFMLWFESKDKTDFSTPNKMSSEIYPLMDEHLALQGKKLSHGAMHYRWNRIRDSIRKALTS